MQAVVRLKGHQSNTFKMLFRPRATKGQITLSSSSSKKTLDIHDELISISTGGAIKIWDLCTGACLQSFEHFVLDLQLLSMNSDKLMSLISTQVAFFDLNERKTLPSMDIKGQGYNSGSTIYCVSKVDEGETNIALGCGSNVELWNIETKKLEFRFPNHHQGENVRLLFLVQHEGPNARLATKLLAQCTNKQYTNVIVKTWNSI